MIKTIRFCNNIKGITFWLAKNKLHLLVMKALVLVLILLVIGIFKNVAKIVTALEADTNEATMICTTPQRPVTQDTVKRYFPLTSYK